MSFIADQSTAVCIPLVCFISELRGTPAGESLADWLPPQPPTPPRGQAGTASFSHQPCVISEFFAMNQITKARKGNRRPVSCLFCRSRKLRCSRNFPCTNCVSRGLNCTRDETSQSVITNDATEAPSRSSTTFEKDVLARLRRLEEVVIGGSGTGSPLSIPTGSPMQAGSPQENSPRSFVQKFDRYNRTERSPSSEVDWLEEEITHTGPSVSSS